MKTKSILATLLIVGCCLTMYAFAASPQRQSQNSFRQSSTFTYAQLVVVSQDGDEYIWRVPGDQPDRVRPLRGLLGDLGGNGRPTLVNVLDRIGAKGWELILIEDNTWNFKRRK